MHNQFLIVGPPSDPARLRGMQDAARALRTLAEQRARFVSRGDNSGTEIRELMLWRKAGLARPQGQPWYIEAGQGMGATLQMASEKGAYTLTDAGTYLAWKSALDLVPLVQEDPELLNVYHVLEPNPANGPRMNVAGGRAFADFMVDSATQRMIGEFGRVRYGQSLFVPDAGKPDRW
jgi:tungstate transport system substrate-binding protein